MARRALLAGAVALVMGCGDAAVSPTIQADVALVLPDGALVSAMAYAVYGPDGTTVLSGSKEYSDRNTPLALNLSVPNGAGYVLELAATSDRGDACDGLSNAFDVAPGKATTIAVTLVCDPTRGYVDQCPVLQGWSAQPAASGRAATIDLTALATDADGDDVISYDWTAPTGSFSTATARATVYTCASDAPVLVTLTLNDNHLPAGCKTTAQLPVGCGASQP